MPKKILTVVGARPQFVKAMPVSRAFARVGGVAEVIVHTGQHFDAAMSEVFFRELSIPAPAYNLGIHSGSHGAMTGRMLEALESVMVTERPDLVLVYGDTNSTLAGGLAAAKLRIPLAHVEAGLRSFNRAMPEEINRVVVDHLSRHLFCPTRAALAHLAREGVEQGVAWVGDVMYDACRLTATLAAAHSDALDRFGLVPGGYAVATLHRAENTEDAATLSRAIGFLRDQAGFRPVLLPLHPRTRAAAAALGVSLEGLTLCPPLGYLDMTRLLSGAALVLTDSGGVQKEAYFHRVPCVTLRDETEWVETIAAGWNRLWSVPDYAPRAEIDDYGDGDAAKRIVAILAAALDG